MEPNNSPSIAEQLKNNGINYVPPVATPEVVAPVVEVKNEVVTEPVKPVDEKPIEVQPDLTDWKAKYEATQAELEAAKKVAPQIVEKILTPEEIAFKKEQEENDLLLYVTHDKKISPLDYEKFKVNSAKPAKEYLFEKYKSIRKEEDPSLQDNEIQIDFENEYNLASVDPKVIDRANQRLEIIASDLKKQEFKNFEGIRDEFNSSRETKAKVEIYKKLVGESKPEVSIPFKFDNIEEPIVINIDYSDIEEELKKELKTPEIFRAFTSKDTDTQKNIVDYLTNEIRNRKLMNAANTAVKQAYDLRVKEIKLGAIAPPEVKTGDGGGDDRYKDHQGIVKTLEDNGIKLADNNSQK